MSEIVSVERDGAIAIITLNAAHRRNALSHDLLFGLIEAVACLQDDSACRAIVLTGGAHFCSGGDLDLLKSDEPAAPPVMATRTRLGKGHGLIRTLVGGRLPVVAAVEGVAFGAGFSLALACDFVVADPRARFCAAFTRVGLQADYGLMWVLPQRVGLARARQILMFGDVVDGTQAGAMGLADFISEPGGALALALEKARRLAAIAPGSVTATKAVLSRCPMPLDTMLAWEADTQALLLASGDFREGVAALGDRRPPAFSGD